MKGQQLGRPIMLAIIGLMLLTIGWVGGWVTSSSEAHTGLYSSNVGAWDGRSIPIRTCTSSYGVPTSTTTPKHPATLETSLPNSIARQLASYTDAARIARPILAPNGWRCSSFVAADGGTSVIVVPPHVRIPTGTTATEETMAISLQEQPACLGCVAALACPIFLNAEQLLGYPVDSCPAAEPPTETVRFLQGGPTQSFGLAEVTDPAGDPGTDQFSGGDYPALGAVSFDGTSGEPNAATLSCVLPAIHRPLCTAIVSNFEHAYA